MYGSEAVWQVLGLGSPPDARPLYVGKAEASLVSRDLRTHFATGTTGQSSARRSFAALLSQAGSLNLVAVPRRRHDPEPKKWTHYALEERGDEQLTEWMRDLLLIARPSPATTHLATVEAALRPELGYGPAQPLTADENYAFGASSHDVPLARLDAKRVGGAETIPRRIRVRNAAASGERCRD